MTCGRGVWWSSSSWRRRSAGTPDPSCSSEREPGSSSPRWCSSLSISRRPSASTTSPIWAVRPRCWRMRPLIVEYSSVAVRRTPVAVSSSSRRRWPGTTQASGPSGSTATMSVSSSSRMSPTTSSAMSSNVTMPAKPPCSSTTMAICRWSVRICSSTVGSGALVGTTVGSGVTDPMDVLWRSSGATASTSAMPATPTMSSPSVPVTGKRDQPVSSSSTRRLTGSSACTVCTRTRGVMTSPASSSRKRRPPSSTSDRSSSSRPPACDSSMMRVRSSAVAPCSSSSTGSMPTLRRRVVEARSKSRTSGPAMVR